MPNLVGIFVSGTCLEITCQVDVAAGYVVDICEKLLGIYSDLA